MQNREQNATTGMQGTFLFGGALELFKWDSRTQAEKGGSSLVPHWVSDSSDSRNVYKWTWGFNVSWTCYSVDEAGFS